MTHQYRYPTIQSAQAADSSVSVDDIADTITAADYLTKAPGGASELEAAARTGALSGTANHRAIPSSNFSADLLSMADKAATDLTGQDASAVGVAVPDDTGSAETPSLSVNTTNPSDVIFTVSGLASDYSGTVTFTDANGKSDVVPIDSNGIYSANLSNLANGTLTYLMTVSDPAGNVIKVDPTATLGDGSANAPAGTPQMPNLLNGYAVRPAWEVAGVDYAVGLPSGTTLKDPSTISMAGVSVNTSSHVVTVTGNNVTLNGYDFSLNGGWEVYVSGASNTVIENSKFLVGSNNLVPIQSNSAASNLTIEYNTMDGGGTTSNGNSNNISALVFYLGSGTFDAEYNSLTNAPEDAIDFGANSVSPTVEFNLISNIGTQAGSHPDFVQFVGGAVTNAVVSYNTIYEPATQTHGMEGVQIDAQVGGTVTNTTVTNNTIIAPMGAALGDTMSCLIAIQNQTGTTGANNIGTVADNYVDPTGAWYTFYPIGGTNYTVSNNVDMTTGKIVQANNSEVAPTTVTVAPTTVTKVVASPSSGTEVPGKAITLTLDLSNAVTVSGTPTLSLNDGGTATYTGGSGTGALTFNYTVSASDSAVAALAITQVNLPNGATIQDGNGNAAILSGAVTTFSGLQIEPPTGPKLNSIEETPASGDLDAGRSVTLTLGLSEAATVAGGTPTLTLNDGGTATYTGGSGTNALTFSYTVGAGQDTSSLAATAVNLNSATVTDSTGNAANLSLSGLTQTGPQIDTTAPSVTGVAASPSSGAELPGNTITLTLNLSEAVTVTGTPTLTLNDGGTATYTGGSGGNALTFSYTVGTSDSFVSALAITQANLPSGATITDAAGNAANLVGAVTTLPGLAIDPPSSGYNDGSANAPAGAPQLPNLLNGEAARPAWKVAGVDYAVGVPTNVTLKDPTVAANLPTGVSIDTTNHVIDITANNVTLNGFDFSLHGGWGISIQPGVTGTTIENCNFSMLGSEPVAIMAQSTTVGSLTVLNCTFNGNNENIPSVQPPPAGTGIGSAIMYNGSGTFTAKYNYIYDMPADGIDFGGGTVTPTVEYNVFKNLGMTPGAHPDPVQFDADTVNNAMIAFNTIYSAQAGENANEGLAIESQGGSTITNTTIENNVIVATGPNMTQSLNIGIFQDPGNVLSGLVVKDNYLDPTATFTTTGFGDSGSPPTGSNLTFTGNVNMLTGAVTQPSAGTFNTNDVTSVVASPSSGSEVTGNTITFTINTDLAFTVMGTPTLTLNDGGTATYKSGSGTKALTFSYTIGSSDHAVSQLAITQVNLPNGATINDSNGDAADLAGAVATFTGLQIAQSAGPTLNSITESPATGDLNAGKTVTLTLKLSEAVTVAGGTPTLTLNDGGTASYTGGSGTNALTFSYTVSAGQNTSGLAATAINLNSATVKDGAGNAANLSLSGLTQSGPQIDTSTSASATPQGAWSNFSFPTQKTNFTASFDATPSASGSDIVIGLSPTTATAYTDLAAIVRFNSSNAIDVRNGSAYGADVSVPYTAGTSYHFVMAVNLSTDTYSVYVTPQGGSAIALATNYAFRTEQANDTSLTDVGELGTPGSAPISNFSISPGLTATGSSATLNTPTAASVAQVGNDYHVGTATSDPVLKYQGADVTAGEFGGWNPIAAVETASGYDVAWKNIGTGQYTVWTTDSNGNYTGNLIGTVSGNSYALESLEPVFNQDLNGDGVTGLYAAPGTTLQINNVLAGTSGAATIATGATLDIAAPDSATVTFGGSTGSLRLDHSSTFSGEIFNFTGDGKLSGSDQIDLRDIQYSSVQDSYANGVLTVTDGSGDNAELSFNGSYTLANFDFASDGSGGTIVYDPPVSTSSGKNTTAFGLSAKSATIGTGATLELAGGDSESVAFAGSKGKLMLDDLASGAQPLSFAGAVSGFGGQNLPGVAFDSQTMLGYVPNGDQTEGRLSLSDGIHAANITLLGNYMASSFATANDKLGGTMVLAQATTHNDQTLLSNPRHA